MTPERRAELLGGNSAAHSAPPDKGHQAAVLGLSLPQLEKGLAQFFLNPHPGICSLI